MTSFKLPPVHSVKANWIPLHYFPLVGSNNCFTIAVVVISDGGKKCLIEANGIEKLRCIYGNSAEGHISFLSIAIETLRSRIDDFEIKSISDFNFGSSLVFGDVSRGSGHSLEQIGASWLSKISLIHEVRPPNFGDILATSVSVPDSDEYTEITSAVNERRLATTLRSEVQSMNPRLGSNFNMVFRPKGHDLPVKLGYSGEHLVADFDRVAPRGLNTSLGRIRSKLWVLAEHRDQTRHEKFRVHEMLVVPSEKYQPLQASRELETFDKACSDIEKEADRREIRFRRFASSHEAAQHIFRVEGSRSQPALPH